ncbi:hypothetical protein B0A55_00336 [Friedmanniomyces simplex]|uniref:Uncharacterized protein n=1 Tax=Friedmanniomyces simplex TaxID=329884 RepID=A0A4V5NIJ8_9PEZI|nr:hypothetical protein B0A55_00336 [Friedmanniomyces simplex]
MASRTYAFFGVSMAALVGVVTSYVTFAPELQKQQQERQGIFQDEHTQQQQQQQDHVISDAIFSDLREAEKEIVGPNKKGALWGLREAIWGGERQQTATPASTTVSTHSVEERDKTGKPMGGIAVQQQAKEGGTNG